MDAADVAANRSQVVIERAILPDCSKMPGTATEPGRLDRTIDDDVTT